jgi:membrane protein implicated in regulation of membrane protease activity
MIFAEALQTPDLPPGIMWLGIIMAIMFYLGIFLLVRMAIKGRSNKIDRIRELELKIARMEGREEGKTDHAAVGTSRMTVGTIVREPEDQQDCGGRYNELGEEIKD